jgi:TolB protein
MRQDNMTIYIRVLIILSLFSDLFFQEANAAGIVVNIDSPQFREVVAAVPAFSIGDDQSDKETRELADQASSELQRLLSFTGIFKVMSDAAFKDLTARVKPAWYRDQGSSESSLPEWKNIGVESLTIAEFSREKGASWSLIIRTIDVARREVLVGKKYSEISKKQVIGVMRRYGDEIMRAYTGKSGIFNSKLVFVGRTSQSAAKQIYISDFDGSNPVQISRGNYPHLSPSFSADGKFVTYTSYEAGNPDLYIYDIAAATSRKLSGHKGINSGGNFAPSGRLLAFTGSVNGDADIYTVVPGGGARRLFISGNGLDVDPSFSPDGSKIAFVSGRYGNPHIFVASIDWRSPTEPRVKDDKRLTYAGWYNATPAWTPEGDRIAFAGYDREIDRFDLFMMNPDGTKLERLTLRAGDNERPWFSPNGQNLVFMSNRTNGQNVKGVHQLYVMNRDGSNQRQLMTGLYEAQTPCWGPNL